MIIKVFHYEDTNDYEVEFELANVFLTVVLTSVEYDALKKSINEPIKSRVFGN